MFSARYGGPLLALLAAGGLSPRASALDFEIDWFSLNGGDAALVRGAGYDLTGNAGVIDAGATLRGDGFELTGGFWIAEPTPCPGDLNDDRQVDLSDLANLLSHFGTQSGATLADGDLNGDGAVSLPDLSLLLSSFGNTCI